MPEGQETLSSFVVGLAEAPEDVSLRRMLRAIRLHLGMEVAFISEFAGGKRVFRQVDTSVDSPVRVGGSDPLGDSYCQRVVDGRLPELIPDTAEVPEAMALPVTTALPVGSHISVPIRMSDGSLYGTLCCFSSKPDHSLDNRDLGTMRAMADLAAHEIERRLEFSRAREAKTQRVLHVLENHQFSPVYQPIYRVDENRIIGFECLTRFSAQPQRPPDQWFAEAAEVGLDVRLELAAIEKALRGLRSLSEDVYLTVNASPASILSEGLAAVLSDVPSHLVVLEVTEHAHVADYEALHQALAPLRQRGLRLAVDDAGAGYASLRHILSLRPDMIKLDNSLIRGLDRDLPRRALAAAFIAFGSQTGCQIIAEGVETLEELEALRALGVRKAQGYLLGRPKPLEDILSMQTQGASRSRDTTSSATPAEV